MWYELVAVGSLPFWVALGIFGCLIIAFIDGEKGSLATATIIVCLAALWAFTAFNPIAWVLAQGWTVLYYVAGYLGLGIVWGWIKWFFYVTGEGERYSAAREEFIKNHGQVNAQNQREFRATVMSAIRGDHYPVQASRNKARITLWMTYWPFSGLWTLINDPVRRTFNYCYERCARSLQALSNAVAARHNYHEDEFKR